MSQLCYRIVRTFLIFAVCCLAVFVAEGTTEIGIKSSSCSELGSRSHLVERVRERVRRAHHGMGADIKGSIVQDLDPEAIASFFSCVTDVGSAMLAEVVMRPVMVDEGGMLEHRRAWIRMLVDDRECAEQIELILKNARRYEQEVQLLFSDFFKGSICPELAYLHSLEQKKSYFYSISRWIETSLISRTLKYTMEVVGTFLYGFLTTFSVYTMAQSYALDTALSALPAVVCNGCMTGVAGYAVVHEVGLATEKRDKIHALHQLLDMVLRVEELASTRKLQLEHSFSGSMSSSVIDSLQHSRYKPQKTGLCALPAVDTFLFCLYENEEQVVHILAGLAEIDMYTAIARQMKDGLGMNAQKPFCFVEHVVDSVEPCIDMNKCWFVRVSEPVLNDIAMSSSIVLQGHNMGGKSTIMRTVLQNIMLGQSLGIAAASMCRMSSFASIGSYLCISDDVGKGLSLFASEVQRAQEIIAHIRSLSPGKYFFFAIDELFSGTAAESGESCAYDFLRYVLSFEGVLCIYATHFTRVTSLEELTHRCKNYTIMPPFRDASGTAHYSYTIVPGVNQTNVSQELALQAYKFES